MFRSSFLSLIVSLLTLLSVTTASCPAGKSYYLQSSKGGNYSQKLADDGYYIQNFNVTSQAKATKYAFFFNSTAKACRLTYSGEPHTSDEAFRSLVANLYTEFDENRILLIGPPDVSIAIGPYYSTDVTCSTNKALDLLCSVRDPTNKRVVYNEIGFVPGNPYLGIFNKSGDDTQQTRIKLIPVKS